MRIVSVLALALGLGCLQIGYSQNRPVLTDRIVAAIDTQRTHALSGSVHPWAQPQYDQGPADRAMPVNHMMLVFRPSAAQQTDLDQLLADQQNPSSPAFHQWLTPDQFGARFGISSRDYAKVVAWLASEGLTINEPGRARNWVTFSGLAAQVSHALHTPMRRYVRDGESHFANANPPAVPEALAGIVGGFLGLDDFPLYSHARVVPPDYNRGGGHYLVPQDFATIYNLTPLYANLDGSGQKIVVVGQSEVSRTDLRAFRTSYGLPANDPIFVPYSGTSPGFTSSELEGDLDLEWAGALAPNAQLVYVYGTSALTAMAAAVTTNAGPIVTISYGACEGDYRLSFYRAITQQGNAQGMTFINASGDAGPAGCDVQGSEVLAARGMSVSFPAALPEVTGVGGTQFADASGVYWAATNSTKLGSALSYIPEVTWNESSRTIGLLASGGGASINYSRPAWQNGPGVPNDAARHVPDIAFSAAGHDAYVIQYHGSAVPVYGTSAGAPSFAAILALLNQSLVGSGSQSKPGLGNINPQLYRLAQTPAGIFHDIVLSDNIVPCEQGSLDCLTGTYGYSAALGYDMATGLGSVDANALVTNWNTAAVNTSLKLLAATTRATINDTEQLTAAVTSATGGTPTGTVAFSSNGIVLASVALSNGIAEANIPLYLLGGAGTATLAAQYSGDANFSGSGATVRVQITTPRTGAAILVLAPDTVWPLDFPDAQGTAWQTTLTLEEVAGVPALVSGFAIDGAAQTVSQYFGTPQIQAFDAFSISVVLRNIVVPSLHTFTINGVDAAGLKWSRQVSVNYLALPSNARNVAVTATPLLVEQNPAADPSCQWQVQLNVDDEGGFRTSLTGMFAGLTKLTNAQVVSTLGTVRQDALSGLMGTVCFGGPVPPVGADYLWVERSDNALQQVQVFFAGPAANPTKLDAAPAAVTLSTPNSAQVAKGTLAVNLGDKNQFWTAAVFPMNRSTSWLKLSQYSGAGPLQLSLTADGTGFEPGAYRAIITLQSQNAVPQFINVPVMFVLGASASGTSISAIQSVATSLPLIAPGSLAVITGTQLANSTGVASGNPLPVSSDGVSVTVNGFPAAIVFRSPNLLRIQIPYEAGAGPAVVGVNNNGRIAGFQFQLSSSAPGVFSDANGSIDGPLPVQQGDTVSMFLTGAGDMSSVNTGFITTATSNDGFPLLPVSVTVGDVPVFVDNAESALNTIGTLKVDFELSATLAPGVYSVIVTIGGRSSPPVTLTVHSR